MDEILYFFKDEEEFFRLTAEQVRLMNWLTDHGYLSGGEFSKVDDTMGYPI